MKCVIGTVLGSFLKKILRVVLVLKKIVYKGKTRWVIFNNNDPRMKTGTSKESTLTKQIDEKDIPAFKSQKGLARAFGKGEWRRFFVNNIELC